MSWLAYVVIRAIDWFVQILIWAIIIRSVLSFFRPSPLPRWYVEVNNVLYAITEPVLGPVRNALPMAGGGLDFSPLIVILLLPVVERLLINLIQFLLQ